MFAGNTSSRCRSNRLIPAYMADFYASDAEGLRREGVISLKVFMEACQEDGVEPFKA